MLITVSFQFMTTSIWSHLIKRYQLAVERCAEFHGRWWL